MDKFKLDRNNSVLMVIDIQERLAPVMGYKDQVVKNTKTLIETAKTMDFPIITTEQYPKGLGPTVEELNSEIDHNDLYAKNSFTAYIPEVEERLKELKRNKIIITGMETHICVFQTTRDLLEAGYNVHIVKDAMASRTTENYKNGLRLLEKMGAIITNTETVLYDLLKIAGTKEFRKLSKLIK